MFLRNKVTWLRLVLLSRARVTELRVELLSRLRVTEPRVELPSWPSVTELRFELPSRPSVTELRIELPSRPSVTELRIEFVSLFFGYKRRLVHEFASPHKFAEVLKVTWNVCQRIKQGIGLLTISVLAEGDSFGQAKQFLPWTSHLLTSSR